jgi:DNA-binding NarL/FixJ family response regulator
MTGTRDQGPQTIRREQFESEGHRLESLTVRERDVSILVAEGLTNRQIGERLAISTTTVRHHLTSVFGKLEIASRFELIVLCYRHRFVVPPAFTSSSGEVTRTGAEPRPARRFRVVSRS